jgi:hypothetical protein
MKGASYEASLLFPCSPSHRVPPDRCRLEGRYRGAWRHAPPPKNKRSSSKRGRHSSH